MKDMKASLALTVYPEDAEHPTQWSPRVSREAALTMLDAAIERAEGHTAHLRQMRTLVAETDERSLEEHERACEAAARRELAAEIRTVLSPVSARLFGDASLSRQERDDLASLIEKALSLGETS